MCIISKEQYWLILLILIPFFLVIYIGDVVKKKGEEMQEQVK